MLSNVGQHLNSPPTVGQVQLMSVFLEKKPLQNVATGLSSQETGAEGGGRAEALQVGLEPPGVASRGAHLCLPLRLPLQGRPPRCAPQLAPLTSPGEGRGKGLLI